MGEGGESILIILTVGRGPSNSVIANKIGTAICRYVHISFGEMLQLFTN